MVTHQTEENMARIKSREWVKIREDTHLGSRLDVGLLDKVRRSTGNGDDEWLRLKEIKLKRQGSCIIFLPVFVYFRWNVLVWVTLTLHSTKKTSSSQLRPARARSALGVGSWLPSYKSLELRSGAARDQGSTNTNLLHHIYSSHYQFQFYFCWPLAFKQVTCTLDKFGLIQD